MSRSTLHADVEWKASGSPGEVQGYASVFGNVDQVGDVVMPGAFRKTISDWRHASQPLPLTADHNLSTDGLIGSVRDLKEDPHGLWFKAAFSRSEKAQRIRHDILDGHLRGTSFIYEPINAKSGRFNGKTVRFLHELRLHEITIANGPLIVNPLAGVTSAKATTTAWDGSAARFTPEQWRRSCLIDTGQGETDSKARYKLPVREPGGDVNVNAVHAAAGALAGGRGGVDASPDERRKAARSLVRLYGEIDEEPPDSLRQLAGMESAAMADWLDSMSHATAIKDPYARKAAVDELIATYPAPDIHPPAASEDAAGTGDDAATETGGTSPDDAYAVAFLNSGPPDGAPTGEPPDGALPGPLAVLERDRSNAAIAAAEADIRAALEA